MFKIAGLVLAAISVLSAQGGRLRVVVTDAAGAPVTAAAVSAGERKEKTDALGVASFVGMPMGRVEVVAYSAGFKTWRRTISVLAETETRLDARLEVGSIGTPTGQLLVSVRDATSAVVIHADVAVKCGSGPSWQARVDERGVLSLPALPAGNCEVEIRAPGFKEWRGAYSVKPGGQGQLEAQLEVSDPGTKIAVKPSVGRRFMDWLTSCTRK